MHGQSLVVWVEAGPFWNCPAQKHAIEFEPEVVVEMAGSMFLDTERKAGFFDGPFDPFGFGRNSEVALLSIRFESHGLFLNWVRH